MKKFLALALAAVMLFTLTACDSRDYKAAVKLMESGDYEAALAAFEALDGYGDSASYILQAQEALLREKLTGSWVYSIDVGEELRKLFAEKYGTTSQMPEFILELVLELKEDGSTSVTVNEEKLWQGAEPIAKAAVAVQMEDLPAENSKELEEIYQLVGVSSLEEMQEFLETVLTAEAFVEMVLRDVTESTGTWSVEGGVLTATLDGAAAELIYDSAADTLSLPMQLMLPMYLEARSIEAVFTRR